MHLIIFLWGFTGILGKLIHKDALHIVWYRVLIAFVALGLFLLYRGKNLRLSKKMAPKVLGVGLIVGGKRIKLIQGRAKFPQQAGIAE